MPTMTLNQLKCVTSEEGSGTDETRVTVIADGVERVQLRQQMNEGDVYDVGQSYDFCDSIKVKIEDIDLGHWLYSHDVIGTASFTSDSSDGTYVVRNEGAHYEVSVAFAGACTIPNTNRVLGRPWNYDRCPWLRFNDAESEEAIRAHVRRRIIYPEIVYQGQRSLCGPSAILYELARRHPALYVGAVKEVYESGVLTAGSLSIRPTPQLLEQPVGAGLAIADWIVVASMRDHERATFDVEPETDWGEPLAGLSYASAMKKWVANILGYATVESESTSAWGEEDALLAAQHAIDRGGSAFLLIDSAMLEGQRRWGPPNHWVTLLGGVTITRGKACVWDDDAYAFDYYSPSHVPLPIGRLRVNEAVFEDGMYGCVWGY